MAPEPLDEVRTAMAFFDATLFTETDAKFKLSGGNYVTWCELTDDRCVLVVHVPEYRRFDNEAKRVLANVAWTTAQLSAGDQLDEGAQLGVGLKGVLLYGAVMVGEIGDDQPRTHTKEQADLYPLLITPERKPGVPEAPPVD